MLRHRSVWWKYLALALVLILMGSGLALGDDRLPEDCGAAGLWRSLLELRTTASALHITAHPDDEDGSSLTLLARGQGVHTMLLSLNRGEGGANLIAPFFFDELGVLRTLELLQANRYYGAELFFTHMVDYGFSKTLDEALTKWGGEEAMLRAVVRVVRRERPEVIISRFRGDPRDGHSHHQAAGLIAQQAFDAAADPNRFPEQIAEGLRPWQPKKLYMNNIRPAWKPEDEALMTLMVDSGIYDPLLGRSYAQIAREGIGYQRSQGTAKRARPAGAYRRYYRLVKTALPGYSAQREDTFFDGLDTSILGMARLSGAHVPSWFSTGLNQIHTAVEATVSTFDARAPEHIVSSLAEGLAATRKLLEQVAHSNLAADVKDQLQFLLARKDKQFRNALSQALGLDMEVAVVPDVIPTRPFAAFTTWPTFNHAIPGQKFAAHIRVINRSGVEVAPSQAALRVPSGWSTMASPVSKEPLKGNEVMTAHFSVQVAAKAKPTRPYWHRESLRVTLRDPRLGTVHPTLTVVPAISVRFPVAHGVLPIGKRDYDVSVVVCSNVKGPA